MTRYKVIGFECGFTDNAFLKEAPMGKGLACVNGKTKAKKFYKDELAEIEKAIIARGCTFEREGKEESRERGK